MGTSTKGERNTGVVVLRRQSSGGCPPTSIAGSWQTALVYLGVGWRIVFSGGVLPQALGYVNVTAA